MLLLQEALKKKKKSHPTRNPTAHTSPSRRKVIDGWSPAVPSSRGGRHLPVGRTELPRSCSPREGHIRGRCPKTCCFPSLLPCPCSEEQQQEGFGSASLLTLQHILNVSGLRSLQEGAFLPKSEELLFCVVYGVPGNQHRSPLITARAERSF